MTVRNINYDSHTNIAFGPGVTVTKGMFDVDDHQIYWRNLVVLKSVLSENHYILCAGDDPEIDLRENMHLSSTISDVNMIRKTPILKLNIDDVYTNHSSYNPEILCPCYHIGIIRGNGTHTLKLNSQEDIIIQYDTGNQIESTVCENGLNLNPESYFRNTGSKLVAGVGGWECWQIGVPPSLQTLDTPTQLWDCAQLSSSETMNTKVFPGAIGGRIVCLNGSFTINSENVSINQYVDYDPTNSQEIIATSDDTILAFIALHGSVNMDEITL